MRLTRKVGKRYVINKSGIIFENKDFSPLVTKLGQLEDIENELGIDLIVFGNVLQALDRECVYVKIKETKQYDGYSLDEETGEIRRCVIVRFSRYNNGLRDWFFTISWGDLSSTKQYLLKDYGKTWALTKEELEKNESNFNER